MSYELLKKQIIDKLSEIGFFTDDFTEISLINAISKEKNDLAIDVLNCLNKNIQIAKEKDFPLCQDTGQVIFWVKIGEKFILSEKWKAIFEYNQKNNSFTDCITSLLTEAVREAFLKNNYRHSITIDPINRKNNNDNTPPIIHLELSQDDKMEISMMLKGGGSENMSALKMLNPADKIQGVRNFILETIKKSEGNACPPLTIGIGIGGNFETCALLAKKSLFRKHDEKNIDDFWANEEIFLLNEINKLNIGPMGLGGITTALKVNIEVRPCHIASLPVAVNLECHAHRIARIVIE
ncbi:MAG: fumarate hydratase [Candidatus Cloacimonetes bacterium]|nr:fumarate hydratase [Candidatus Cloacimonadota bacterium]